MILGTRLTERTDNPMIRPFALSLLLIPATTFAQERYATRNGEVSFFSSTPMEDITAANHKATCVMDLTSGRIQVSMLIKAFEFEKALMQEHFNENYMESNTFPKADLQGTLKGLSAEDTKKPGKYAVTIDGELTIHGVVQKRSIPGTIEVDAAGAMKATAEFIVKPADHGIRIPGDVNVAKEIRVNAALDLRKM